MFCPVIILIFSLALIVLMVGMVFLQHVKKDGLGRLHKFVAYLSVSFSIVVLVGAIVAVFIRGCHGTCHEGGRNHCRLKSHGKNCNGESCLRKNENHTVLIKDDYCIVDGKKMKQSECMVDGKCIIKEECKKGGDCCEDQIVEKKVIVIKDK